MVRPNEFSNCEMWLLCLGTVTRAKKVTLTVVKRTRNFSSRETTWSGSKSTRHCMLSELDETNHAVSEEREQLRAMLETF